MNANLPVNVRPEVNTVFATEELIQDKRFDDKPHEVVQARLHQLLREQTMPVSSLTSGRGTLRPKG